MKISNAWIHNYTSVWFSLLSLFVCVRACVHVCVCVCVCVCVRALGGVTTENKCIYPFLLLLPFFYIFYFLKPVIVVLV